LGVPFPDVSEVENLNRQADVWHCSICTYENPKNRSACDMCGVIRNASPGNSQTAAAAIKGTVAYCGTNPFGL
jgi:hypothetical protein